MLLTNLEGNIYRENTIPDYSDAEMAVDIFEDNNYQFPLIFPRVQDLTTGIPVS
jgi:hypothetical protein